MYELLAVYLFLVLTFPGLIVSVATCKHMSGAEAVSLISYTFVLD